MHSTTQRQIHRSATTILLPFLDKWIAGTNAQSAIKETHKLGQLGGRAIINVLGEAYQDKQFVEQTMTEYLCLVSLIAEEKKRDPKFDASISIKPSQFGTDLAGKTIKENEEFALKNIREIVQKALENKIETEIDMEEAAYTDFTLFAYKHILLETKTGVTVCLQAKLKRSLKDLIELAAFARSNNLKARVRLVKGVYPETENLGAFSGKKETIENFKKLVETAFENRDCMAIAIGTHREDILLLAEKLSQRFTCKFEVQMLKGIRKDLQEKYLQKGNLAVYVPYGKDAIEYVSRRIKVWLETKREK